ncbi:site-specific integrase [Sphingomonas sp. WKB10]|nr:site-specific integrase [Sphingomonas sp. WKB10]
MCSYLVRRGATYYFRRSIPLDVRRALGGRAELIASLRTKDRPTAKRLVPQQLIDSDRLFDEARQALGLDGLSATIEARLKSVAALTVEPRERPAKISIRPVEDAPRFGMLDEAITDRWAIERKVQKKGEDAHRAVARWFYERVGRKPVGLIERKDVLAFKDALVAEGQSLGNVRVKLSRLRTLLQWAADNELVDRNVATGVTVKDVDKGANKRLPFDLASLNRVFSCPIYKDGVRPVQGRGEASYWLPLLALFTGARMEELGQLRPCDVRLTSYPDGDGATCSHWFIHIVADEGDGLKLKNAGSERIVPIHPLLAELGFLSFASIALNNKQLRLFPALKENVYGRLTAKWGEWFNPYMRSTCHITDRRMVFHSFRHTFKDYARLAGIEEGIQRQIMGHSSGDVADNYGSGFPLHKLVEGIKRYKVPGLVIAKA